MALAASRCEPVGSNTARGPHWCGCLANTHPSRTTGLQRLRATVAISGSRHVIHQEPRRAGLASVTEGLRVTISAAEDGLLVLNGIDVDTGDYLTPRLTLTDVASALRGD